jgi:hypothetical protein
MLTGNTSTGYSYGSYYGNFETSRGMLPLCRCELPMVIYISNTSANPGRRFWKCRNWMKKKTCGLLVWDDELDPGTRPMVAVTSRMAETSRRPVEEEVESKQNKCNCVEVMEGIYDLKKEKWKKKLLAEKQKVEWLKWIMVASCVLFCVFYARK